ncbi:DUF5602 domain-containing protein [Nibrella saemangeumensis]|uniref:DUF5602 domain-containing protein n=1 Tax=Nibrella saemangeumensis TaxID=1084526 RepID=A0ABP8MTJ4_9BACT
MSLSTPHQSRVRRLGTLAVGAALLFIQYGPVVAQTNHGGHANVSVAAPVSNNDKTILGEVVPFGNGTARSWVRLSQQGNPTAVGVTLTEAAMQGLPADITPGMVWMAEYIMTLPDEARMLPFNHIAVNWNPRGHMPSGVYNVPHFDFHFYMISRDERNKITARGDDLLKCRQSPGAGAVPEGYIFAPESEEPGMGGHWADPGSHEFHGKDFTSTFIFGSYNGKVIFWEPMITKAYLETKPNVTMPLKLPAQYAKDGYYPTSYSIRYDAKRREYTIALEEMKLRQVLASK